MKKISKTKPILSAEAIARLADKGQDVSVYFTNKGKMMPPLENLGIELNEEMIEELNDAAKRLSVSKQTLIKRFIRRGLDQHYLEQKTRRAG